MTIASIDIGTNSTRLLIAELDDHRQIRPICMAEKMTRLGDGLNKDRVLDQDSITRVIQAVAEYKIHCQKRKVEKYHIFATSAARDARNKREFLQRIDNETGLACRILTGDEEARLSFLGALSDFAGKGTTLVCDVGGGSTEFVIGDHEKIFSHKSIDIGSRRMHHIFLKSDPVQAEEILAFKQEITTKLQNSLDFSDDFADCIMLGGTATTLAMMDAHIGTGDAEKVHHYLVHKANLARIIEKLAPLTFGERKKITGLHPDRADVILAGALLIDCILQHFELSSFLVSIRDLMFGIILEDSATRTAASGGMC